jgi:hypothetical protein
MKAILHALAAGGLLLLVGCGFGPKALCKTRLPYNDAVKSTSEEQLLLNIVRLRYSDNISSLAVSSIAAQFELARNLQLTPFFTSAAAGDFGGYEGAVLPGAQLSGADRPTLSYTPQDEVESARRLFTPLSLEGVVYLARTTWPIATVFRLYLENLNWVPNAQSASGPTPKEAPEYERFLRGILALQRLQDANNVALILEEHDERIGSVIPAAQVSARELIEAAKAGHEFKRDDEVEDGKEKGGKDDKGGKEPLWALTKKREAPHLYVRSSARDSADWQEFCRVFRLRPDLEKYEVEVTKLNPFPDKYPRDGVKVIDLETRSLLQVLYFSSQNVEVPPEHVAAGLVRVSLNPDGSVFDYDQVFGGLFKVRCAHCKSRPKQAAVAILYHGYWYYIDETDHDTRATFALLLHLSRLELGSKPGTAPVLTLPLGGR